MPVCGVVVVAVVAGAAADDVVGVDVVKLLRCVVVVRDVSVVVDAAVVFVIDATTIAAAANGVPMVPVVHVV